MANYNNINDALNEKLPIAQYGEPILEAESTITDLLFETVPDSIANEVEKNLSKWSLKLEKIKPETRQKVNIKRKKYLTRDERLKNGLLKLQKVGWNYSQLAEMRSMWLTYMRDNLEGIHKCPEPTDAEWTNVSTILSKSELTGADITVIRSTVPNLIGTRGTIVLETKATLQIVTPNNKLKILLKKPTVFQFVLDKFKFTVFGKHIATKPSERSVKKIKTLMHPDL
ncbi:PREDICTED: uncharacterized protein LOC108558971 [Nicrophorus vespilloides]|uniref:Ribonuclease P protein subunit p29 n=1 Tax=Nicrophorus vespilloides TaxID=110193 RepID=A0ABM1MAG6_NICVS|nr:PREDICTED: uncharacterized protein LOC108558971 [Nicrophorus vespilloides]